MDHLTEAAAPWRELLPGRTLNSLIIGSRVSEPQNNCQGSDWVEVLCFVFVQIISVFFFYSYNKRIIKHEVWATFTWCRFHTNRGQRTKDSDPSWIIPIFFIFFIFMSLYLNIFRGMSFNCLLTCLLKPLNTDLWLIQLWKGTQLKRWTSVLILSKESVL